VQYRGTFAADPYYKLGRSSQPSYLFRFGIEGYFSRLARRRSLEIRADLSYTDSIGMQEFATETVRPL
jgi:hypothetical protein